MGRRFESSQPSRDGLLACWAMLAGAGLASPWDEPEDMEHALRVWVDILRGMPDDELIRATREHLRASPWWPKPAQLLKIAPPPLVAPRLIVDNSGWPGQVWGKLGGNERIRVLDDVVMEGGRCRPGCSALDCPDCSALIFTRCDEIAAQLIGAAP